MKRIRLLLVLFVLPVMTFAQWTVNEHLYSQSMTATCAINDALTNVIVNDTNLQVVAMNGNECCGAEMPTTLTLGGQQKNIYFLTIYGESNAQFQICVWDIRQSKFLYKSSIIDFVMNNSLGFPTNPYVLNDGYRVSFNANGGTGTMPDQKFTYGESQNLSQNTFTYADHFFRGWSTSTSGQVQYADGAAFSTTGNDTLYAQWRANSVTITATAGVGGHISPAGVTDVSIGQSIQYQITPDNRYTIANVYVDGLSVGAVSNYVFHNVTVNHTITAEFEFMWSVSPNSFEHNMNIMGQLQIDGIAQTDTSDVIGVFDNGQCVGLARPMFLQSLNSHIVFLTVYGNTNNRPLDFNVYDASADTIYEHVYVYANSALISVNFQNGAIIGSAIAPVVINAKSIVQTTIPTEIGWNWFSTNVHSDDVPLLAQFVNSIGDNGVQLKSQASGFYQYCNNQWMGNLTAINNEQCYLLNNASAANLSFTGIPVEPSEVAITLNPGWNWIGYTPSVALSPSVALANHTPHNLDIVKSQSLFSQYVSGLGWLGNLNVMMPGIGYMYQSCCDTVTEFTYAIGRGQMETVRPTETTHWEWSPNSYPTNMTFTVSASIDNEVLTSEYYEIAAFCGETCRGTGKLHFEPELNRHIAYLTVNGNPGDVLQFKLYDELNAAVLQSQNSGIIFESDKVIGSPLQPHLLQFESNPNGIQTLASDKVVVYPNPVQNEFTISAEEPIDKIEILNTTGVLICTKEASAVNRFDVSSLTAGTYVLKVCMQNGKISLLKFIKK